MALYHSAKGSVNYTVVGSPTIVDGVASGFSNGNFLELSQVLSLSSSDSVEALFDITTGTDTSSEQFFFSGLGNSFAAVTRWGLYAGHLVFSGNGSGFTPYEEGTELLAANTNYKVKLTYENQIVNMYLFVNNAWQKEITINNISFASFNRMLLGSWPQDVYENTSFAFRGSIDLNNTYIKANGQPWFGVCPVEVKKHQVKGPMGYTVIGSPTITEGVASGFSSSNYLKTAANNPTTDIANVFFQAKVTVAAGANEQAILGYRSTAGNGFCGIYLRLDSNRINWDYGKNADTGTTITLTTANNSIAVGDSLIIQAYFSEGNPVLRFSKDNGQTWVQNTAAVSSSLALLSTEHPFNIGVSNVGYYAVNQGTIDLNNTYIKVNGKLWYWQPAPTKYIIREDKDTHEQKLVFADLGLYLTGPVNYTVVGSPTITDGVVTSNSASDYVKTTNYTLQGSETIEFGLKIKPKLDIASGYHSGGGGIAVAGDYSLVDMGAFDEGSGYTFRLLCSYNNGDYAADAIFSETRTLGADDWFYTKVVIDCANNTISVYYSFNGSSWTLKTTKSITNGYVFADKKMYFLGTLFGDSGNAKMIEAIDLKETYIKVNGSLLFYGKNYASANIAPVPAGYTYGNTTTPSIGYVDMRTQEFTAAPSGATIGRDE